MSYTQPSSNSLQHTNYQTNNLLTAIQKAFNQVNSICTEYFQKTKKHNNNRNNLEEHTKQQTRLIPHQGISSKIPPLTNNQPYQNFNNYKCANLFKNMDASRDVVDIDPQQDDNGQAQDGKAKRTPAQLHGTSASINKINPIRSNQPPSSKTIKLPIKRVLQKAIPLPPKAPLSPYFTFYKQKKDLIKQQFPEMSVTQIAAAAAKVWKSLSQQQKRPYTNKYWQQKNRYADQMKKYTDQYPNYKEVLKKTSPSTYKK